MTEPVRTGARRDENSVEIPCEGRRGNGINAATGRVTLCAQLQWQLPASPKTQPTSSPSGDAAIATSPGGAMLVAFVTPAT